MRFHKLRIAWSVFWGLAAVLLIVLWVRSYSYNDNVWRRTKLPVGMGPQSAVGIGSNWGFIFTFTTKTVERGKWHYWNQPAWERTDVGFEWKGPGIDKIKVPDVFPIVIAISSGVAPWIRWSNRFTLRTLLIATTLVAVVLGLIVWLR